MSRRRYNGPLIVHTQLNILLALSHNGRDVKNGYFRIRKNKNIILTIRVLTNRVSGKK